MAGEPTRGKILVASIDSDIRLLLSKFLDGHAQILLASEDGEAVGAAVRELPELVILDHLVPGLDGLALSSRLRMTEKCNDSVILIVSIEPQPRDFDPKTSPYNGWMKMPFTKQELLWKLGL